MHYLFSDETPAKDVKDEKKKKDEEKTVTNIDSVINSLALEAQTFEQGVNTSPSISTGTTRRRIRRRKTIKMGKCGLLKQETDSVGTQSEEGVQTTPTSPSNSDKSQTSASAAAEKTSQSASAADESGFYDEKQQTERRRRRESIRRRRSSLIVPSMNTVPEDSPTTDCDHFSSPVSRQRSKQLQRQSSAVQKAVTSINEARGSSSPQQGKFSICSPPYLIII